MYTIYKDGAITFGSTVLPALEHPPPLLPNMEKEKKTPDGELLQTETRKKGLV